MNKVILEEATIKDSYLITEIMREAFNYDTAVYFGEGAEGGPPGYATGTLAKYLLNHPPLKTYLVKYNHKKVGFISIDTKHREIVYFCLFPSYINQGIGTRVWGMIEERFGEKQWYLETPNYSLRNHHFYEKFGFIKYEEKKYQNDAISYVYKK